VAADIGVAVEAIGDELTSTFDRPNRRASRPDVTNSRPTIWPSSNSHQSDFGYARPTLGRGLVVGDTDSKWSCTGLISFDLVIDFPNHSRLYDATRRAVRFWGHDSAIKASVFINEDALKRIQLDGRLDESGFLKAFDSNRDLICAAAAKLYVPGSRGSCDLVAANF
jgi:hypothetical protein